MEPNNQSQRRGILRIVVGLAALAITGTALSACGLPIGAGNCTPNGASSGSSTTTINVISDPQTTGAYEPRDVNVSVGQSVTWNWQDQGNQHSVTAADGGFDSCLHGAGYQYTVRFTKSGTYTYKCSIHPQMTGRITVS